MIDGSVCSRPFSSAARLPAGLQAATTSRERRQERRASGCRTLETSVTRRPARRSSHRRRSALEGCKARPDPQDRQDRQDRRDLRGLVALPDPRARPDLLAVPVRRDPRGLRDPLVVRDLPDPPGLPDPLDPPGLLVRQDPRDRLVETHTHRRLRTSCNLQSVEQCSSLSSTTGGWRDSRRCLLERRPREVLPVATTPSAT